MSRHRFIRDLDVSEELDDDYDEDFYGDDYYSNTYVYQPRDYVGYSNCDNAQTYQKSQYSQATSSFACSNANVVETPLEELKISNKEEKVYKPRTVAEKNDNGISGQKISSKNTTNPVVKPPDPLNSLNLVIVGHVDAGKSTLMGHLLYILGNVDEKTMHRNRKESARLGKSSFAFAWILDEDEEERQRGVTMDIAMNSFVLNKTRFNIMDAPGHKDFVPNMISGVSQADAALLVVNATRGEFETGFEHGGQTREHSLLLRSFGVNHIIVAINKMDTLDWSHERFNGISETLNAFLVRQAGFGANNVKYVPLSGLMGINLRDKPPDDHPLRAWYRDEKTLTESLSELPVPKRLDNKPLRIIVNNIAKCTKDVCVLHAKVESGSVKIHDKLLIMPDSFSVVVKDLTADDNSSTSNAAHHQNSSSSPRQNTFYTGDQIQMTLIGTLEPDSISLGHVICRDGSEKLKPAVRFLAKILTFDIKHPIIWGTSAELFVHSLRIPCIISTLKHTFAYNKETKKQEKSKEHPRLLSKNTSAMVEIKISRPICVESDSKALGRIALRTNGRTIAAGIVESVVE